MYIMCIKMSKLLSSFSSQFFCLLGEGIYSFGNTALQYTFERCFRVQSATMEGGQLKVKPLAALKERSCTEERLEALEQKFQQILSFLVKLDIQVLTGLLMLTC